MFMTLETVFFGKALKWIIDNYDKRNANMQFS